MACGAHKWERCSDTCSAAQHAGLRSHSTAAQRAASPAAQPLPKLTGRLHKLPVHAAHALAHTLDLVGLQARADAHAWHGQQLALLKLAPQRGDHLQALRRTRGRGRGV